MRQHADIAVVGGGPIGAAFALSLKAGAFRVSVLEAKAQPSAQYDARTLALSYGAKLILERIGIWSALEPTPIHTVHVSQRGGFGRTLLEAQEMGVPALGYVINYSALARALESALSESQIDYRTGAVARAARSVASYAVVDFTVREVAQSLTAKLVVLADGGKSVATPSAARLEAKDYHQSAVVGLVKCERAHKGIAYERFTADGPVALLPYADDYAFVWTANHDQAQALLALGDEEFVIRFQDHFGEVAGRFLSVDKRSAFPLSLRYVRPVVSARLVRIGNAAQILHPVAAQGLNLGLRDAWTLASSLNETPFGIEGEAPALERYRRARALDAWTGIGITDLLVRGFSNDNPLLRGARGVALQALDSLPPLRRLFTRKMLFGAYG